MNHVRTRLIAKVALVLLSLASCCPSRRCEARELAGSSSSAKTVKTAVKKRHTTVTRRYSSRAARARRARLARARAAARARQWREVSEPRYKLNDLGETVPDIRAEAAIIYNPVTQQVLWEENSQNPRSIASITKVMTAEVVLEDNPDLTREVVVERSDVSRANHTYLRAGERVTIDDLLHLTLIASDNAAARALARTSPLGTDGFVRRMNEKARELGLQQTSYTDPSGLLADNVSSAFDMARLIAVGVERRARRVDHADAVLHGADQPPRDQHPQHESAGGEGRRRCARGEDRLHLEGGLLPGDAAAPAAVGRPGGRRRPRRALERRPVHGDAAPVQLAEHESRGPESARAASRRSRSRRTSYELGR